MLRDPTKPCPATELTFIKKTFDFVYPPKKSIYE